MTGAAGRIGAALAAACLALLAPAAAGADPGPPRHLSVRGGADEWHAAREFKLSWSAPDAGPGGGVVAARYEIRDEGGHLVTPPTRAPLNSRDLSVHVPAAPGAYALRLRLEDDQGSVGPAATARLRFDETRPPAALPLAPEGWLGRDDFPLALRLQRQDGPEPVSGVEGYAVSVAPPPGRPPCGSAVRCSPTTAALPAEPGSLRLASLPEGESVLRVQAVSGAGIPALPVGEAELRVDTGYPVTRLHGLPSGWTAGPVRLTATAADAGSGMGAHDGAYTALRIGELPPVVTPGPRSAATLVAEGTHRVAYYARDAAGNAGDGGAGHRAPRTAAVRIDRTPPRAGFAAQRPRDPELIVAEVRDSLSGADSSRGWVGLRPRGSGGRFEPLGRAPAPAGQVRARWDSDAFPRGDYEFRVTAFDAAGNRTRSARRADGARMVLTNPVKATTSMRLGFGGRVMTWHRCARRRGRRRCFRQTISALARRPARRTVPNGRGMRLSGRLIAGTLGRVPGAPVRIVERFAPGAAVGSRSRLVRTDAAGRFRARLRPGPSRAIVARFAGGRRLVRSRARVLRLEVRSGVRMRASSGVARVGGAPIHLRGRVAAGRGEAPPDGLAVALQFRLPGLPWSEFRTVRTDRRGRFDYAYSFSDDDSRGARFLFRAFVPRQSDWPYEPGGSRPVAVVGI